MVSSRCPCVFAEPSKVGVVESRVCTGTWPLLDHLTGPVCCVNLISLFWRRTSTQYLQVGHLPCSRCNAAEAHWRVDPRPIWAQLWSL